MKNIRLILLFLPFLGLAQNRLTVEVEGVQSSSGNINIAIYNQKDGFLKFESVFLSDSTHANAGRTEVQINNLPNGEYALAVFHDENGNNILDTNWLGIPKEPIGFSQSRMKTFGPPSFKECAFRLSSDKAIKINL
ncbi:DUF2141 domain-containing protein [uncultured Muriicola sp.]|uniref:DUF2141 domain-containing protein n=1 Tax=uncultured Muriicola sp. TaxID=1583102 RepID=UPI0026124445|nr:DUF2141 domain-containing protein [uncultured Muriicola sp.]